MTDEKLDQILKQALSPMVSDEDIKIRERKRSRNMNKTGKRMIAVAACAAMVVAATTVAGKYVQNDAEQFIASKNLFTIRAMAAEMEEGVPVPVSLAGEEADGYALCGVEEKNAVSYCVGAAFTCEGEEIASVTYAINKGAFRIEELKGAGIVTDYEAYSGAELSCPLMGFADAELAEGQSEADSKYDDYYASEYTVLYDKQSSETSMFSICGEVEDPELHNAVFDESKTEEEKVDAYTKLMEGVEITCTVTYASGATDSKVIVVKGCMEEATSETDAGDEETHEYAGFAYELKAN